MSTLGTAYVQIVPSAQGLSGSISNMLDPEASSAGLSAGAKIGAFAKKALIAAGVGAAFVKLVKSSMAEGGKLQQSYIGGLETIYGKAAGAAREYAKEAAKSGISMNTYSEQAVSFGAALRQAYGGDTKKAVEAANTAILDMADNQAKMGTDITMIQNAYQGFAKQNYTMLDNLKLGYGGTKTEMQRLLKDAEALTGKKYDISNLGDVYEAIHVIQGELGLTGVAAAEAEGTFTGSFASMKAAAQNFLGELALGMDVTDSLSVLLTSANTFFFNNFIPMLGNIVKALPGAIGAFIQQGAPMLMQSVLSLVSSFASWINGVANGLTSEKVKAWLTTTLPKILSAADGVMSKFLDGLLRNIGKIALGVGKIGLTVIKGLGSAIWGRVTEAANGIRDRFMAPINSMKEKVQAVVNKIKGMFPFKLGKIINFKVPSIDLKTSTKTVLGKSITYPSGFGISWHARGGIYTNPTLLTDAAGNVHGVGDGGAEAIVPLDVLWSKMAEQTSRTETLLVRQTQIISAIYEEMQKEKNFRVDGIWAGRYVNSLVR